LKIRVYGILFASCCLVLGACSTVTSRSHPAVDEKLLNVESVAVLPPLIEVYSKPLTGKHQRQFEDEATTHVDLIKAITVRLNELGYTPVTTTALWLEDTDAPFTEAHEALRTSLKDAVDSLEPGQPLSLEEANGSIAAVDIEHLRTLAEHVDADALLFVRHIEVNKTGGHIAADIGTSVLVGIATLGWLVPISGTSASSTEAALVHMETGEILWTDRTSAGWTADTASVILTSMPTDTDPEPVLIDDAVEASDEQ